MIIDGKGVIECKLTNAFPSEDGKPEKWRGWTQLKVQCEILDVSWGLLVVFHQSVYEMRYYFYQRDPNFRKELKKLSEEWQKRVDTESYYDPETSEDAYIMFQDQEVNEEVKELDMSCLDQIVQIQNLKEIIKSSEKSLDAIEAQLMFKMGNAEKARCGAFDLNWGMINYRSQPEKIIPAKPAYSVRRKRIRIKERRAEG